VELRPGEVLRDVARRGRAPIDSHQAKMTSDATLLISSTRHHDVVKSRCQEFPEVKAWTRRIDTKPVAGPFDPPHLRVQLPIRMCGSARLLLSFSAFTISRGKSRERALRGAGHHQRRPGRNVEEDRHSPARVRCRCRTLFLARPA